ncbi:MAG TPA: hypothetical protein HA364_03625 [Thermoplasmata archaeon]|nr:hypothetical protein [Thermoplasmata archaeon]
MTEEEKSATAKAGKGGDAELELSLQSRKFFRKLLRSLKATWKLYRSSKSGLAGLAIVFGFFFVAAFAPFISPYDP